MVAEKISGTSLVAQSLIICFLIHILHHSVIKGNLIAMLNLFIYFSLRPLSFYHIFLLFSFLGRVVSNKVNNEKKTVDINLNINLVKDVDINANADQLMKQNLPGIFKP